MLFYLSHETALDGPQGLFDSGINYLLYKLRGRQRQVGSLAGAAHLLNDNTGVLRLAQWEQKSHVEQKGKS